MSTTHGPVPHRLGIASTPVDSSRSLERGDSSTEADDNHYKHDHRDDDHRREAPEHSEGQKKPLYRSWVDLNGMEASHRHEGSRPMA